MALAVGLGLLLGEVLAVLSHPDALASEWGTDLWIVLRHTQRVLAGGSFYLEHQLHGPYVVLPGDSLYPPTALLLFAPFLVLPTALWWLVPAGIVGAVIAWWRPGPWALAIMVWSLWYWRSVMLIVDGNPVIWIAAAVAAGTVAGWPFALVLVKPSLLPLTLLGVRRRSWWLAVGAFALVSIPFLSLWADYVHVIRDSSVTWAYSLDSVPLVLIGVWAWLGRTRASTGDQSGDNSDGSTPRLARRARQRA